MAAKNRGLLSLMRRHEEHLQPEQRVRLQAYLAAHPVLQAIYEFELHLRHLLLLKHRTPRQCPKSISRLLLAIDQLRQASALSYK